MVSVVIPAYNESSIIKDTVLAVAGAMDALGEEYEIIVADDGSTDGTAGMVAGIPFVRVEGYRQNAGKGCAVRTGVMAAEGEFVICTDADLAYGTDVFGAMLELLRMPGTDLVIGSRRMAGGGHGTYPPLRRLASACFNMLVRALSGLPYDTQCGIKGYRRAAAQDIFGECSVDGFSFDFEVLMRARAMYMTVREFPAVVVNFRESKVRIVRDSIRMFRDLFRIRGMVRRDYAGRGRRA